MRGNRHLGEQSARRLVVDIISRSTDHINRIDVVLVGL